MTIVAYFYDVIDFFSHKAFNHSHTKTTTSTNKAKTVCTSPDHLTVFFTTRSRRVLDIRDTVFVVAMHSRISRSRITPFHAGRMLYATTATIIRGFLPLPGVTRKLVRDRRTSAHDSSQMMRLRRSVSRQSIIGTIRVVVALKTSVREVTG